MSYQSRLQLHPTVVGKTHTSLNRSKTMKGSNNKLTAEFEFKFNKSLGFSVSCVGGAKINSALHFCNCLSVPNVITLDIQ